MKKPTVQQKLRALRLAHLVQSLGWDGAREYIATMTPEEKKDYFATSSTREH